MANFILAYFFTIFIEGVVVFLLLRKKYNWTKIIRNVVFASSVTLPLVWFVFPLLPVVWIVYVIIAEVFVVISETIIYKILFKMEWKAAFVISFIANLISFVIGFLIF